MVRVPGWTGRLGGERGAKAVLPSERLSVAPLTEP